MKEDLENLIALYREVYDRLDFITQAYARVRATGDLLGIHMGRVIAAETKTAQPEPAQAPPQPAGEIPAYDPKARRWHHCDKHPDEPILHYGRNGRPYLACKKCGDFLNPDGTRTPMKR